MNDVVIRRSRTTLFDVLVDVLPWSLLVALFVMVGVMHVASRTLVVRIGYELSLVEQESHRLSREHDRLQLELTTLKSPARLEALAKEQLHMVPPTGSSMWQP